jgi:predicted dehydrogenase
MLAWHSTTVPSFPRWSSEPRVGLIGYGDIAQLHARHLSAAGARVVGAVTRRTPADGLVRYASLEAMLPDVDAVTVAVPNHLHTHACLTALTAGKAVFLEKPWCLTDEACDALERALDAATVPVHAGFRLRWNPRMRHLKHRLRGPRRIACRYRLGIERLAEGKPWTRREVESGGALFTLGVHALDLARWLAGARGEPLEAISASAAHRDASADFPLVARVRGRLGAVEIEVEADLRGDAPFHLGLEIDADQTGGADDPWPGPGPEDAGAAEVEYAGLMAAFVAAVGTGAVDREATAEILQLHRDLLAASVPRPPV